MPPLQRGAGRALLAVLFCGTLPLVGHADEGFWLFNRVPRAAIEARYGVDITDGWLQRVQLASVRFPGGSGSFVSPTGLVLTNHHVALDIIQELSSAERDYVKNGFFAHSQADELRAPNLQLVVLERIEDVTSRVNAPVTATMTPAQQLAARRAVIASIEDEAEKKTGLRSEMVTLYHGAQYHLYLYRTFTDVRLVFAPEFQAAFFGGDPDNFTYPRYALDMALFRVYEDGRPLAVKNYLPWSLAGAREGEVVFTSGHPGPTQRLNTIAHLEALRDHSIPANLDLYGRIREALDSYRQKGAEQERQARDLLFGIDNSLKSWRGQLKGLQDPALMEKKRERELSLRSAVRASADYRRQFGDAWDKVAAARRDLPAYNIERVMFEGGLAFFSEYFTHARTLLRWAEESGKPAGERLPEYIDPRRPQIERQIASDHPIYPEFEQARVAIGLTLMRDTLGTHHTLVKQVLAGKTPEQRAQELVRGTRVGEPEYRTQLFTGGAAAMKASTDPFIEVARLVDARARELRRKYDNEVLAVERDAYAKIAQAIFATEGDSAYPDATFTLRLSYGAVKSYEEDGKRIAPFSEIRGLYARADHHGHKPPYDLPERWAQAKGKLDLTAPYNFVTTNDIVGGNSGSPVINARGELVGLIFDGNIHSLPAYFIYDDVVSRAVSVDVRGMLEALRVVYGADALANELLGR